ncbi:hypothetical protein, partial [Acidovorax sp. sic0104]|uniref:hypothetical protein n=1 Tax=Acidovorax sp. sic0104 TaxID=2854784 RepID=UPI001C487BBB
MEIDTGAGVGTSSILTIKGYRNGSQVASDTFDTGTNSGSGGNAVVYSKNAVTAGFGGTLTFGSDWYNIDEIRITGTDTIVAVDDLNFEPAVVPNVAPTATNLTQSLGFTEDAGSVALADIAITDPDAGDTLTATLTLGNASAGSLSTGTFGSATSTHNAGTGVWTVSGSISDVNAALAAVAFTPAANWSQNTTITTRIRDAAGTGPADGTITLNATAVNDAPVATVPATISVTEDVATALTGISFSDVDAGSSSVTATLSVSGGTLAATSGGGVTVGGTATALTLTGSASNINTFVAGSNVTFTTAAN